MQQNLLRQQPLRGIRSVSRLVFVVSVLAITCVGWTSLAAAAPPQIARFWVHGNELPLSAVPQFAPQERVEIKVPANSTLQSGYRANILMCSDPGGSASNLPVDDTSCDGTTIQVGHTLDIEEKGAVNEQNYTIYKLPTLTEPRDNTPICNATHACVLYVGQDQNDFHHPYVWSTPFYVGTGPNHLATDGTSGSSGSIILLVVGIVVAVAVVLLILLSSVRHRRNSATASSTAAG